MHTIPKQHPTHGALLGSFLAACLVASAGQGQQVYTYSGQNFTSADPPYTTSDSVSGSFSVANVLPPLMPLSAVSVGDYTFSDGVVTFTAANSILCQFQVATDAAAHIVDWRAFVREPVANPGDPQHTMTISSFGDQAGIGPAGAAACDTISLGTTAMSSQGGVWADGLPAGSPTTYSYAGEPFSTADPPYTTSDRITGSFEVAAPLPDFMSQRDISFALTNFSFGDGVQTRTPANSTVCLFEVATDGAGHIAAWRIGLRESGVSPGNPQQLLDSSDPGDLVGVAPAGATDCANLIVTTSAISFIEGVWNDPLPPGIPTSYAYTGALFTFADPPYTTANRLAGSIDLPAPLPPFLPPTDIAFLLENFSFGDGIQNRTPGNSLVCGFEVTTDGAGQIIQWSVALRQAGVATGDPQQTMDSGVDGDTVGSVTSAGCLSASHTFAAGSTQAGAWTGMEPPALPVAYSYRGDPLTFAQPPWLVGDRLTGGIAVAGALPPNMPLSDIRPFIVEFSFTDRVQTRMPGNSELCGFEAGTDALGRIVQWRVFVREAGIGAGNPQLAIDSESADGDLVGSGLAQADPCGTIALSASANSLTPGTWIGGGGQSAIQIPTLSESMLIALAVLLAALAVGRMRRRQAEG